MKIAASVNPILVPNQAPRAAAAGSSTASQTDGFQSSPRDDFAAMKPSAALLSWAEKAEVKSLPQMFETAVAKDPGARYLGRKVGDKFEFLSYAEADVRRKEIASGLVAMGIQPGERVASFAENSPEWVLGDLAILSTGAVHAPLYRDSKADAISFNLQNCKATTLIVDTDQRLKEVLEIEDQLPDLKTIITMKPTELKSSKAMVTWDQLTTSGREKLPAQAAELAKRQADIQATDVAALVFTSGTTGTPKGVVHTHGSFLASTEGALRVVTSQPTVGIKDVHLKGDLELSLLPLGHIFERTVAYALTAGGAALAYPNGHGEFMKDAAETKPTVLAAVPALYDKIRQGVQDKADATPLMSAQAATVGGATVLGGLGAALGAAALGAAVGGPVGLVAGAALGILAGKKLAGVRQGHLLTKALDVSEKFHREKDAGQVSLATRLGHALASKAVLQPLGKKVQEKLGSDSRILISGGAPLSDRTSTFFWETGFQLSNGYGTSEIGVTNVNPLDGQRLGTVGSTVSNVELSITPDEQFEGAGEILFRGPTVMLGYLNDAEKTAEAIDAQGFYHTGDVGKTDASGHLLITDRLKNFIALSSGKKVAAGPIEGLLKKSPYIARAVLVGEKRAHLGALLVPNYDRLGEWARANGRSEDPAQLAADPAVTELLQKEARSLTSHLDKHEQIWKVAVLPRDFHEDELAKGEPKRPSVLKTFAAQIDSIYSKG